ncbi:YggU family protein [Candidatus Woesearchaeota archaeon CG_4_10_14_0_2_um_filter_33_13]|nr:MAG: YggU family protein [Candidatus Woesearchaeota archaeon CG_4_10_14_0_2_um_filter_33_13]
MDLNDYIKDGLIKVKVTPNASRTELKFMTKALKLYLQAVPEKGKANAAVIKFFKKEYGLKVEIKSGELSREKVLRVFE